MEMRDLVTTARENVEGFAGILYGLLLEERDGIVSQVSHTLPNLARPVVGAWCDVHVRGWEVPYRRTAAGTLDEGCVYEAVWCALDDLGAFDDQVAEDDENAPQTGSQGLTGASADELVTDDQRTELNNLITEVAMAREVSFGTAKGALMKTKAASEAGLTGGARLEYAWQADILIGQLRRWLEIGEATNG